MVWLKKCRGPDIKKIRTNKKRPRSTTGPAASNETLVLCNWAGKFELWADILVSLNFDKRLFLGRLNENCRSIPDSFQPAAAAITVEGLEQSRADSKLRRQPVEFAQLPRRAQVQQ